MIIEIQVLDRSGQLHCLEAQEGEPLMYALRDAQLGVEAVCGGCCICGTCHVYVGDEQRSSTQSIALDEEIQLDGLVNAQKNSRLACQIMVVEAMQSLVVEIAPVEL